MIFNFHSEIENQNAVRLSTRVVKSNSRLNFYEKWLKRSWGTQFQDDPTTGCVGATWFSLFGRQNLRF